MKFFHLLTTLSLSTILFQACDKTHSGSNIGGGLIPTNYIALRDSSFTPAMLTVVSGSSITFLNQTPLPQHLMTDDSTTIRDTIILPNKFYFFKKDTSGTFPYHISDKPSIHGTFNITP